MLLLRDFSIAVGQQRLNAAYLDKFGRGNRAQAAGFADGQMFLPLVFGERQSLKKRRLFLRAFKSLRDDLGNGAEARTGETSEVNIYNQVRGFETMQLIGVNDYTDGPVHDGEYGMITGGREGRGTQVDCNDDVRSHFLCDVHGEVVQNATVDPEVLIVSDGGENRGQRHGCAESFAERSVRKDVLFAGIQIGCDAAKRNGQIVEAFQAGVGQGRAIQYVGDTLSRAQSARSTESVANAEFEVVLEEAFVFLAAIRQSLEGRLSVERLIPVDAFDEIAKLGGAHAGRVHAAD